MKYIAISILMLASLSWCGCQSDKKVEMKAEKNLDPHSYANSNQVKTSHLSWDAEVDFNSKQIKATATWTLDRKEDANQLVLDTYDLDIDKVTDSKGNELSYELSEKDDILGSAMSIQLKKGDDQVVISYVTSSEAAALQWLNSDQTLSGEPFLFTQSQAILARSWIPCQDSPGIRFTYDAEVQVPLRLLPLMSATNPQKKNDSGKYRFKMEQPIPAYLMALAVGDLAFKEIGKQTGVYAEPSLLDDAHSEFIETQQMLEKAEKLYGPYQWDRYDLLVLPPSFPFGGMENPRITFATPTIITGDRSLVSLVAHELAHSWSGNLVTTATWNDFWLNEGFTVYFENRIMEAVYGKEYAEMLAYLSYTDLKNTIDNYLESGKKKDTSLKLDLEGRDPDEGVSAIAYDKGFFFLRWVEKQIGTKAFDQFLNDYFTTHAFLSIDTDQFIEYLRANAFEKNNVKFPEADVRRWIFQPGMPEDLPMPESALFQEVEQKTAAFLAGALPEDQLVLKDKSTHEILHFLQLVTENQVSLDKLQKLDKEYNFSQSTNAEIQTLWYVIAIREDYQEAFPYMADFLKKVGRRKFLMPIYEALVEQDKKELALEIYEDARPGYHFVSYRSIDQLLGY
ncbi:MAG: M1 family metallopeptidase [Cyclobacteriaceae bacterium]|nr:M1 family metallopeptidase [Cyclobacteriaceae bacterium]MCH8514907.1 M1 family metallopeptidase [Cyclobacteriaceae bacterium]